MALLFIISLLVTSTPSFAAGVLAGSAREAAQDARYAFLSNGWAASWQRWFGDDSSAAIINGQNQTTPAIARIQIESGSVTLQSGETAFFIAIAYDGDNRIISGTTFTWRSERIDDNLEAASPQEFPAGRFAANHRGTYKITAEAGGRQAEVIVTVVKSTAAPSGTQVSTNVTAHEVSSKTNRSVRISPNQKEDAAGTGRQMRTQPQEKPELQGANNAPPEQNNLLPEEPGDGGWNNDNWGTLDEPGNQTGNPTGGPLDDGAGNANFQLSAPVISLPGRGIDLALNLNYNSRLWNKAGNQLTYDIDQGFPAPGWSLGFGKIVYGGSNSGCMVVDADGTRHSFAGKVWGSTYNGGWNAGFSGYTSDGTFIDYQCDIHSAANNISTATAKLPNGTVITYQAASADRYQLFPVEILDANGNFITISYRLDQSGNPQIEYIQDTIGRIIHFYYDAASRLFAVNAQRYGSGAEYTIVRLHYKQIPINATFAAGIQPIVRNYNPWVIDAIYYPGTNTGYWFGDADSYSSYGMIAKVVEQRGMTWAATGEEQGTVNSGQMTKQAVYNYPLGPNASLTNAPTYTTQTASWAEMTTAPAVTTYNVFNNETPRRTEVIQPDGTKSVQYSYNAPNQWYDGLIYQDETYSPTNAMLAKSRVEWWLGQYQSPIPAQHWVTDERNQTILTQYDYTGGQFNQVTNTCQYGYTGNNLRCERTEYENRPEYIGSRSETQYESRHLGRHIFNLVKSKEISQNNVRASRVEYEYDNNFSAAAGNHNLVNTPGAVMHKSTFDPFTTETHPGGCARWGSWYCCDDPNLQSNSPGSIHGSGPSAVQSCPDGGPPSCRDCEQLDPPGSVYDLTTSFRGNVTRVRTFTDGQNLGGAIDKYKQYDITGNVVMQNTDCCEQMSFTYDGSNGAYAYPISQTRGSSNPASPDRQTSLAAYDRYTGVQISATDYNGIPSTVQHDPYTLRPTQSVAATGSYVDTVYNDAEMLIVTYVHEQGGALASQNVKYLNGLGQVRLEAVGGANNTWENAVATEYDQLGRVKRQTRPYRTAGDTLQWSENFYDAQGRLVKTVAPDGSTAETFYNETARPDSASAAPGQTVKSRDAWGRERWARYDEQERMVEVVEPNSTGNGSVLAGGTLPTTYLYNTLGNLVETIQGAQHRYFRYDSLGRLTRQKLAEQAGTLDSNGDYVGTGSGERWSEAFWYDDRSNPVGRRDARGVKINYNYNGDALNRLQSITYDASGPHDTSHSIEWAPNLSFEYEPGGDKERIKRINMGWGFEDYAYDTQSRVKDYTVTMGNRPNNPMTTSYLYDSLDRVTETRYPAEYGQDGAPRKIVAPTFENLTGRLASLKYDGQQQAGNFLYNSSEQVTSMKVGTGANQITETSDFDSQTGLLTNQKVIKASGESLLDLSYSYNRDNSAGTLNGKTGAVTGIVNNLDRNKDRAYEYDALGRLTKAVGGTNQTWTQAYAYDRYGNRTSVTATGVQALRTQQQASNKGDAPNQSRSPFKTGQTTVTEPPLVSSTLAALPPTADELVGRVNSFVSVTAAKGGPSALSDDESERQDRWQNLRQMAVKDSPGNNSSPEEKAALGDDKSPRPVAETKTGDNAFGNDQDYAARGADPAPNTEPTAPVTTPHTPFDFDGDGKADLSTWTRSSAVWNVLHSNNASTTNDPLGAAGNQIAPGDYDGDGKYDEAVWSVDAVTSNGTWTIKRSSNGTTYTQQWGSRGDTIVPADYDGDGKTDIAVWRAATGQWYILQSSNGQLRQELWGGRQWGDIPTNGDYDGDGHADIAVWRPINGLWYLKILNPGNNNQTLTFQWGMVADVPAPADYDGDGHTDLAVWRPSTGVWYIVKSSNGQLLTATIGSDAAGDVLVPADYDGDGQADIAVWRPSTGVWTIRQSTTGTVVTQTFGASNQIAVPSAYIRRSSAPSQQSNPVQRDGLLATVNYDENTNRITTPGYEYDMMGNLTKAISPDGVQWLRYEYDAANRLALVKNDDSGTVLQQFVYGAGNERLVSGDYTLGYYTFYAMGGMVEYHTTDWNNANNGLTWTKSSVYLGNSLLSTVTPLGANSEQVEYHHPDQLGTRLVTNPQTGTSFEQTTLPYGNTLTSETTGTTSKAFTSYERSAVTGLDYAQNRTYDSGQGRFTQVDPIGMRAASLLSPQSLNLYSYCGNDPINHTDPSGLFFGSLFRAIGKVFNIVNKILKWVAIAVAVVAVSLAVFVSGGAALAFLGVVGGIIGKVSSILGFVTATAEGGAALGVGAKVFAGLYGVGAIASRFQQEDKNKKEKAEKTKDGDDDGEVIVINTRERRWGWWDTFKTIVKVLTWPWSPFDDDNEVASNYTCKAKGYVTNLVTRNTEGPFPLEVVIDSNNRDNAARRAQKFLNKEVNAIADRRRRETNQNYKGKHINTSDINCQR